MNKTFENCTLLDTKTWFDKARPESTPQDFRVQLGVHLEEVAEMLSGTLGTNDPEAAYLLGQALQATSAFAEYLKKNSDKETVFVHDHGLFLDALCDQIVTATGVAHTCGYDVVGAMVEVNRSNFSKFAADGTVLRNEVGKIIKGPLYSKAVLTPYLPQ